MTPPSLIECHGVGKVFHTHRRAPGFGALVRSFFRRSRVEFVALRDVDLTVAPGEFVGLIGANGAGKTTLVKCLTGIIPATSGDATVFGRDAFHLSDAHKRRIALVMGQRSQLWWDIPPLDSFRLLREIYEIDVTTYEQRLESYAERLDVTDRLDVQLRQLSLGQRMKMEIIGALLHDPEIVFLDEPTIGLDLVSQDVIRSFLREINHERGATIVLTSHDMEDIEQTCHRLLILDQGSLVFDGDLVSLQRRLFQRRAVDVHLEPGSDVPTVALEEATRRHDAVLVREAPLQLSFEVPADRAQAFIKALFDVLEVRDLAVERQPLEQLIRQIYRGEETAT